MPNILQYYKSGIYSKDQHGQVLLIFSWSYIILTSKNWQLKFCRSFIFKSDWAKRAFYIWFLHIIFEHILHTKYVLYFFENVVIWFSWNKVWKENYCDTWLLVPFTMSDKVLRFCFIVKDYLDRSDYRIPQISIFYEGVEA